LGDKKFSPLFLWLKKKSRDIRTKKKKKWVSQMGKGHAQSLKKTYYVLGKKKKKFYFP